MSIDLAKYDEGFERAEVKAASEFENVPDGKYQARVDKVEIREVRNGKYQGEGMLSWQFVIEGGKYDGRRLFSNNMFVSRELDPDQGFVARLKKTLDAAGLKLTKLSELEGRIGELLDRKLSVTVKNTSKGDKEFCNVYVNSVAKERQPGEDDIPW